MKCTYSRVLPQSATPPDLLPHLAAKHDPLGRSECQLAPQAVAYAWSRGSLDNHTAVMSVHLDVGQTNATWEV
eukprot:COSAG01_NODE_1761_length_9297_cov_17.806262_3_plen_73_part_00